MPSYIFKCVNNECQEIDKENKIVKKMTDPNPNCNVCTNEMQQVYKPATLQFKGKNWVANGGSY